MLMGSQLSQLCIWIYLPIYTIPNIYTRSCGSLVDHSLLLQLLFQIPLSTRSFHFIPELLPFPNQSFFKNFFLLLFLFFSSSQFTTKLGRYRNFPQTAWSPPVHSFSYHQHRSLEWYQFLLRNNDTDVL